MQSFLGFCNFYRRFIREYGVTARPLTALTKKEAPFTWTDECESAFQGLKRKLTQAPLLRHFDPELPTCIETDASAIVAAGVLS